MSVSLLKGAVALIGAIALSGCAAPLMIAGTLAATEGMGSMMSGSMEVRGSDLVQMADWDNRYDRNVTNLFGHDDWSCAYGGPGSIICVPDGQDTIENTTSNVNFRCRQGSGGLVTMTVINQDAGTMYCTKI